MIGTDRHWDRVECDASRGDLDPTLLRRLVRGDVAVVLLKGVLDDHEFDAARTRARALLGTAHTTHYVNGTLTTIGPYLAKYLSHVERYFAAARATEERLAAASFDLAGRIRDRLRKAFGLNSLEPAREPDGRRYGDSVIRLHADGVANPLHNDNIMRDAAGSGLTLAGLAHQLSCVVCIEECAAGGELRIYRKPWRPDDEHLKIENGLGYRTAVVDGVPRHTFKPHAGDVYLINPTYYHEIERVRGSNRTTLGFFIGWWDDSLLDGVVWG